MAKLTDPQRRALEILAEIAPDYEHATTCRAVARHMWPDSDGWRTLSDVPNGVVRGKAMPGLAGRLLWRLWLRGLVSHKRHYRGFQTLYYLNESGREALDV